MEAQGAAAFQLERDSPVSDRSPNLDMLRSLAVSFVVLSHLLIDNAITRIGNYHTQTLGTLGVMIFFVHTCLVLMRSLKRQDSVPGRGASALSFLVGRAFRIYPLSLIVVLLLAIVGRAQTPAHPTLFALISNIFLVQNLTGSQSITPVLWSLPFEVQMYFFLPGLYRWTGSNARAAWVKILALWCAAVALVGVLWWFGINFDLIKFFPCFLPGVLAYCLRNARHQWSAGALFSYVGAVAVAYPLMVGLGCSATVLSWIICLILGALIPRCADIKTTWLNACASIVARYSYGIYLVHVSVLNFAFHHVKGIDPWSAWMLFIGGVVGLPYIAYHLIEKPGIDIGHALLARMTTYRRQAAQNI